MKKVKISLVAIALVLGIGGAFATQLADPDPCDALNCIPDDTVCCTRENGTTRFGDLPE